MPTTNLQESNYRIDTLSSKNNKLDKNDKDCQMKYVRNTDWSAIHFTCANVVRDLQAGSYVIINQGIQ